MTNDRKLWVIDTDDEPEITRLGEVFTEAPAPPPPRPAVTRNHAPPPPPARKPARRVEQGPRLHSAILLTLAYLLGPAALLLTSRGRRSGMWTALATLCSASTLVVVAGWWSTLRGQMPAGVLPVLVITTVVTTMVAATVWSRGLHLLLTSHRFPHKPWPTWLQNPWCALLGGLAAPGSSLAMARRPTAAAWSAWLTWPGLLATLLLVPIPLIWRHRGAFASAGVGPDQLEYAFGATMVIAAVGLLYWVAQALTGARAMAARSGRWQSTRGDWSGVALAAALVVFMATAQPVVVATDLSQYATAMSDQGYKVLPLGLNVVAQRLDPGQVAYALQSADLHVARGDAATADLVRADLERRMRPYMGALARADAPAAHADPAPTGRPPALHPFQGTEPEPPVALATATTGPVGSGAMVFLPGRTWVAPAWAMTDSQP